MAPQLKRRLTHDEEFEVMKMVMDKFLWLGTAFIGWGLFKSIDAGFQAGMWHIIAGAIIMLLFAYIILKEFEHLR